VTREGRTTFELLLIDGNNLLHRLSGRVDEVAQRNLFALLRARLAPDSRAMLLLDGHPAPGSARQLRIAPNLEVRQVGDADRALLALIEEQPPDARGATVLVTDDRSLADRARSLGAQARRLDWLVALIGRGRDRRQVGLGQPARPGVSAPDEDDQRAAWQPGRGATRKRGNPRRAPRRRR
jgi:hypothetical protein